METAGNRTEATSKTMQASVDGRGEGCLYLLSMQAGTWSDQRVVMVDVECHHVLQYE